SPGNGGVETWVVRGWDQEMASYFESVGAALEDVIDLDLEDSFVELLRTFRSSSRSEPAMYRVILYSQWTWSRLTVLRGTIAGFALPIVSLQGAAVADRNPLAAQELLRAVQSWGTLYPVLATTLGLLVAIATWAPDHRGRHIHALSLPLPRWRYVLLRFAAGVTVLAGPIVAVLLGAGLATALATIPPGVQGYPLPLALRLALAL